MPTADHEIDIDCPAGWQPADSMHRYHWTHDSDGPYPSIRIFDDLIYTGHPVEIHPDPRDNDSDQPWRTPHDTLEEARARVLNLMKRYPE